MELSPSILRVIMNRALEAEAGISIPLSTVAQGTNLRQRLYKLRSNDQEAMKKLGVDATNHPWKHLIIRMVGTETARDLVLQVITEDNLHGELQLIDNATGKNLGTVREIAKAQPEVPGSETDLFGGLGPLTK